MNIPTLKIKDSKTLIILGAGATRGADCFNGSTIPAPLDNDFFHICQRVAAFDPSLNELLKFVRREFSSTLNVRMEKFFSNIESLDEFYHATKIKAGPQVKRYQKVLSNFPNYIATIFQYLQSLTWDKKLSCIYHEIIVQSLSSDDIIISFNYDCIMDEALKKAGKKKWNPGKGYGTPITAGTEFWKDHSGNGRISSTGIRLLKVHGSLNWERKGSLISLREDPYAKLVRNRKELIAPVWNKRISEDDLILQLWKQSRLAIKECQSIILIGYSVPETDLFSQSLLKVSASERKKPLSNLIVVNPDNAASQRSNTLLGSNSISENTNFYSFNSLKDLADCIHPVLRV
ncbi:hypothetical protein CH352_00835 [Leptospira hartskeerlii]|uniref:Uncharacterized protein n=1 Tax=Leptospira hartskeerlii TaxID=2023177 RepID=A0A2M9X8M3_9LEPT|nr:SIR2 family protein [Leptospira hartskeerlii]PJZ23949.1 hypothetical protein CH357_18415 [Leptospira hartskeerlii]PJZ35213.1 hypothetical protein CH352_00835 [Leptospira hartskeerlii]